jgi:hypothetical protein
MDVHFPFRFPSRLGWEEGRLVQAVSAFPRAERLRRAVPVPSPTYGFLFRKAIWLKVFLQTGFVFGSPSGAT